MRRIAFIVLVAASLLPTAIAPTAHLYAGASPVALPGGRYVGCAFSLDNHTAGVGAGANAWESTLSAVVYWAGTDGPVRNPVTGEPMDCLTNGVVTSNAVTDPDDCVGTLGYDVPAIPLVRLPAHRASTLTGANAPTVGVSQCHGWDGVKWVFFETGVVDVDGTLLLSVPFAGTVTD